MLSVNTPPANTAVQQQQQQQQQQQHETPSASRLFSTGRAHCA
jgi:hypothetical protein